MANSPEITNLTGDILIVDDETPNLQLLTQVLSDAGYRSLRSIKRPQSAIESALAQPPNLILLDVRMPEMDGFEVCERLKQDERTSDIPIIFVSALQDVQERVRGFEAGGVDFISKPFQEPEVLARVRTHLTLRSMQLHLEDLVAKRTTELVTINRELEAEIIERQQVEDTLASSEKRLRALFDWANDGILTMEDDRFTSCNHRALEILKRPQDEVVGHNPSAFSPTRQPDGRTSKEKAREFIGSAYEGESMIFEWVCTRGDGTPVDLEVSLNSVDIGQKPMLLSLWRDITRRKHMEAERERANLELKQAYDEIRKLKDQLEAENLTLREEIKTSFEDRELIGESHVFQMVLKQVEQVAVTDSTVLILGETGTGKGLIARKIHQLSGRRDRLLVNVNCAALPATLIESEFFGHEKGAFTGATDRKIGRFELADSGTIFLDEIGDLPIDLQAKLLRVLQDQEFERIGSSTTRTVDTRIIAATNRDLDALIEQGTFRADLYYRLGVFPIRIPPLRERPGDIPLLIWCFITMLQPRIGKKIDSVPARVMDALTTYDWPGNVRELQNMVERAMILSPGASLELGDALVGKGRGTPVSGSSDSQQSDNLEDAQRIHIIRVLEECGWKIRGKEGAAERLGLKRTTLQSRMKKLGIKRPPS
jgi:PAS domain S-box-containing protein